MSRFTFTILLGIIMTTASAQPMQQFLFTHLGIRDGLASDETMGVQQDQKGYIWIATLDGLQRYDGRRLLTFRNDVADKRSIPNDMIKQIQFDKINRLWLCCNENKVGWFDVSDFTFHVANIHLSKEMTAGSEGRFFTDSNGNVMLLLAGIGIFTYDEHSNEFSEQSNPFRVPSGWKVNWITQDPAHHNYWVACDSGLAKFNPQKGTLSYRGHNTDQDEVISAYAGLHWVTTPYFDKASRCWLLAWPTRAKTFFYSYDLVSKKTMEWESQFDSLVGNKYYYILTVKEQKDGTLWVIGRDLFARLNKAGTAFDVVKNNLPGEFSIRYDGIRQLYEDRENNLWASTANGLFHFNPAGQRFHAITSRRPNKDSIYETDVTDILQTKKGEIIVSTWGKGLFSYDTNFNPLPSTLVDQSRQMGETLSWCIWQRSNGDIWRGNQYGTIFITDGRSGNTRKIKPPVFAEWSVRQIAEDRKGDLWLSTTNGLLVKWLAAQDSFILVKNFKTIIQRLYADTKGFVWVCTQGNGLYKINTDNDAIVENYTGDGPESKRLMRTYAMDIVSYGDSLYMIASGGINILNSHTNTITYLSQSTNFPANNITNIIRDRSNRMWVTSLRGLGDIDLKMHIASSYDQRDGVHTNFFNGAATALLNDGRIVIGTSHDLLVFDPKENESANSLMPDILITGFVLMNKPLLMDSLDKMKTIELQHDQNSVIIEFSTLSYQNTFGLSYMLEGLDKDWVKDHGENQAIYTYLPPGNYTFKIKLENGDQARNAKPIILKIKVKAPFWKTWWFFSLLAFVAIGVIYSLDKFRVGRIRETERVRTRIATSLTKDMGNTLGNINVLSEMAKLKLDKDLDRTRDYISQISDNSHRMMEVMDDMVWSINPENDELQYTILRMKKYALAIQSKYGVEVSFNIDEKVNELKLQMDRRYELFLIFKEALLNAGRHANSKFIDVNIRLEKSVFRMIIADNGRGFDTAATDFGRGLNEIRKKAAMLKATLAIRSEKNTGTEIILDMNL